MLKCLQEKLSREAFSGNEVRLLNSKNILIADTEGSLLLLVNLPIQWLH